MTEKQVEELLVDSVRSLPLLDGGHKATRQFKLLWDLYDRLIEFVDKINPEFITQLTYNVCDKGHKDFDYVFARVVSHLNKEHLEEIDQNIVKEINKLKEELRQHLKKGEG